MQNDLNVWRLTVDPRIREKDPWTRVVASTGLDASPQYSPDGTRLCFRSDRTGKEQLWVSAADGSNQVAITEGDLHPSVGKWSPGGESIVFNNSQDGAIYLAEEAGPGKWTVRGAGATGYHPVFSADGQWIYAGTMTAIVRIPVSGGPVQQIFDTRGISLSLSPDGRALYFVRDATDSGLWRLNLGDGRVEKVLDGLVPYCSSCWAVAPNGTYYLGASSPSQQRQAIFFHEFASGAERIVAPYPEPLLPIGSGPFSLSADARHLLVVRVDPTNSDIMRVEDFR